MTWKNWLLAVTTPFIFFSTASAQSTASYAPDQIVKAHLQCSAYYRAQSAQENRMKGHLEAGAQWLEVHFSKDINSAAQYMLTNSLAMSEKVKTEYGGNFNDPRIGTDFDGMCAQVHPGLTSSGSRVDAALLAAARARSAVIVDEIIVKTLTGKTIKITSTNLKTIADLKDAIQDEEGIPPGQQRLIYAGRTLEDGRLINDYNIESGAIVHLILKLN